MIIEYKLELPSSTPDNTLNPIKNLTFERFLRLNPIYIINDCEISGNSFSLALKDHDTEEEFDVKGKINFSDPSDYRIEFESGVYKYISIRPKGDVLIAEVDYRDDEVSEKLDENTFLWLKSIREYLRLFLKNSLYNSFFRIIMDKIILTMTPSQRKVSLMLYRVTLVEILAILLILVGYVLFMA